LESLLSCEGQRAMHELKNIYTASVPRSDLEVNVRSDEEHETQDVPEEEEEEEEFCVDNAVAEHAAHVPDMKTTVDDDRPTMRHPKTKTRSKADISDNYDIVRTTTVAATEATIGSSTRLTFTYLSTDGRKENLGYIVKLHNASNPTMHDSVKAMCQLHKQCHCWISAACMRSNSIDLVESKLSNWLKAGLTEDWKQHGDMSRDIKEELGMKPRQTK
jgi:hypothetical protein